MKFNSAAWDSSKTVLPPPQWGLVVQPGVKTPLSRPAARDCLPGLALRGADSLLGGAGSSSWKHSCPQTGSLSCTPTGARLGEETGSDPVNATLSGSPGMEGGAKFLIRVQSQVLDCCVWKELPPCRGLFHPCLIPVSQAASSGSPEATCPARCCLPVSPLRPPTAPPRTPSSLLSAEVRPTTLQTSPARGLPENSAPSVSPSCHCLAFLAITVWLAA